MLLGKAGRAVCQGANASLTGSGSKQSLRTGGKTQQWETNKQTHLQDGVQLEAAVAVLIETGKGAPRALQPELPAGGSTRSSFINTSFCLGFLSKQKYMCSAHFSPAPCRGQHVHSSINVSFLSTILYQSKCMCTQTHVHTHPHTYKHPSTYPQRHTDTHPHAPTCCSAAAWSSPAGWPQTRAAAPCRRCSCPARSSGWPPRTAPGRTPARAGPWTARLQGGSGDLYACGGICMLVRGESLCRSRPGACRPLGSAPAEGVGV